MKQLSVLLAGLVVATVAILGMSNVTFVILMIGAMFAIVARVVWAMRFS